LIEADASAGTRFRAAAARLDVELDTEARRFVAADAARLLMGLALSNATDELGELLMPDPAIPENKWTVACYEMGGLTPVAVRDFDDPVEALVTVSACPDEAHVAAELVASNESGLRWTAVWRTDDHVSFQLPSPETAEGGEEATDEEADEIEEGEPSEKLLEALSRWSARLSEWSGRETVEPTGEQQAGRAPEPIVLPAATTEVPPAVPSTARLQALELRLGAIESTLGELNAELQAFVVEAERRDDESSVALERAMDVRFQVLAKVMQSSLDRLSTQLVDAIRADLRAGLTPLTKEVIERISVIETQTRADDRPKSNVIDMRSSSA
jgi:hypothetical protein